MTDLISTQLKAATADLHQEVENKMSAVLFQDDLRPESYQQLLAGMYSVYEDMENAVCRFPSLNELMTDRSKLKWLESDLLFLSHQTGFTPSRPPSDSLQVEEGTAWGMMYVMEGATLGGAVISRHLANYSWVSDDCLSFFVSYGDQRGKMWKAFIDSLENFNQLNPELNPRIMEGAHNAFHYMNKVLE